MKRRLAWWAWVGLACGTAAAQVVIGEVVATDASVKGSVVLAAGGMRVLSGSTVTAGQGTAELRLARGGEVRVCPNTNLTAAAAANGRDLALGFGTGAVELHYQLASTSDSLQTPDFRLLLAGPGIFHLAIAADMRGNTCVRPLPGNTASVIVNELMGDGVYQVKPTEVVLFRSGKVGERARELVGECGCPAPPPPVQRAQAAAPAPPAEAPTPAAASELHVEVDAPIVFRAPGAAAAAAAAAALPEAAPSANALATAGRLPAAPGIERVVLPPTVAAAASPVKAAASAPRQRWFSKVKAFFAAMFK